LSLPRAWRDFVSDYLSDYSHWFVPKARAVLQKNVDVFKQEVKLLLEDYEGHVWDQDAQELFARDMEQQGLYSPREIDPGNFSFRAREEKQVLSLLGLAWIDSARLLRVTQVGRALVETDDEASLLAFQVLKWQFWNPSIRDTDATLHRMQLSPHLTLLKVLRRLNGHTPLRREEFCLFVAKSRSDEPVVEARRGRFYNQDILTQIEEFRKLEPTIQEEVLTTLRGAVVPRNIFKTVEQDSSYTLSFLTFPPYVALHAGQIVLTNQDLAASTGDYWESQFAYVPFDSEAEWMEFYGDPWRGPRLEEALERYQEKRDVQGARRLYRRARAKKVPGTERSEEEFVRDLIQESELETWLSQHLEVVESALSLYSDDRGNGRQYPAGAWAIDLLAQDSMGTLVVLELKKRSASDQVFGQLCRYVGWVREHLAGGRQVRGIIIAKELDDHLRYALRAIAESAEILRGVAWSDLGVEFEETGSDAEGNPIIRVLQQ